MSSHREAPQISKDPTADSTDLYAFVSPDKPSTVTLIANYIPLQAPDGGPNFYEFADDVLLRDQHRQRRRRQGQHRLPLPLQDREQHPVVVPLQRRADHAVHPARHQRHQLEPAADLHADPGRPPARTAGPEVTVLGTDLLVPPCNIGPLSTPNYAATYLPTSGNVRGAEVQLPAATPVRVFAGQRAEGFYVDLGCGLRPRRPARLRELPRRRSGGRADGGHAGRQLARPPSTSTRSRCSFPIAQLVAGGKAPSSTTSPTR